jgi:GTP cyclohydrolase I
MAGIQDRQDDRGIALERVGVAGLVHPVTVTDRQSRVQTGAGTVRLSVELGPHTRGVHMSRFVEILGTRSLSVAPEPIEDLLDRLKHALEAPSSHVGIEFTLFVEKKAPRSGRPSLLACPVVVRGSLGERLDLVQTVTVPVMTVCPCSREATGGPGHSQRGHVTVSVRVQGHVWLEELVELVEESASAPVFALLTGEDERSVIAAAHENAMFVEDLVRNVAERLDSDVRIVWYRIEAENLDSVHDHNLFASVERSRL